MRLTATAPGMPDSFGQAAVVAAMGLKEFSQLSALIKRQHLAPPVLDEQGAPRWTFDQLARCVHRRFTANDSAVLGRHHDEYEARLRRGIAKEIDERAAT